MTYVYHKDVSVGDIHIAPDKTYADQTARLAATFVAADIDKLLKQTSDGSFWRVTAAGAPGTSVPFAPPVPVVGDIGKSLVVESDGASGVRFAYDTGGILWSRAGTVLSPQTSGDTVRCGDGTAALPAWSFDSTTNMGMYRAAASELGFSVGGSKVLSVLSSSVSAATFTATTRFAAPLGTSAAPGFAFTGANDNGIFSSGSNSVKIACNASETGEFAFGTGLTMVDGLVLSGAASNIILESNTQTSGNVVSIKSTPGSASTAIVMRLEADGTNWGSGSHVLEIISDDDSCIPLTVNNGSANTFLVTRPGNIQTSGSLTFTSGGSIVSTANGDITLLPNGTGITIVGSGGTLHGLASQDDFVVTGQAAIGGTLWADSFIRMVSNNALGSDNLGQYGAFIPRNTNQTPDAPVFTTGIASNSFLICEWDDRATDFSHAQQTNPTLFIQSADATNITEFSTLAWNNVSIGGGKGSYLGIKSITEEVTISVGTGSTGVATSGNLAPANSIIFGATARITQDAGSGALAVDIGVTGSGNQDELIDALDVTTLGNTGSSPAGNDGTQLPIATGSSDTTLTLTTDFDVGTSDLKVRVVVFYCQFTAPTS
jgi:hypothetical protein